MESLVAKISTCSPPISKRATGFSGSRNASRKVSRYGLAGVASRIAVFGMRLSDAMT